MIYTYSDSESKSGKNTAKILFLKYLYLFVLIIYAGSANSFVQSLSSWGNPFGLIIPILISVLVAFKLKVVFDKNFYILILCFLIYFFASTIKYKEIHPRFCFIYLVSFLITYITVKALKFDFFRIYEKLLYYLAITGLLLWFVQILLGGNTLYNILGGFSTQESFSRVSGYGLNAIIYSVQYSTTSLIYSSILPRNCGYAWEPGGFASFLCLAIYINLFISKAEENKSKRFWVLFLALISTQSTTGYTIAILIIGFYFYQRNYRIIFLILPFVILALTFIFTLPFMGSKIDNLFSEVNDSDSIVEQTIGAENKHNPQRFVSFVIAFRDFKNNPILGYGGHDEDRWFIKIGANISTISGIGDFLAKFGLVGFLFFIILTAKSSKLLSHSYNYKGDFLLLYIIFLISISYGMFTSPLVSCFWMFSYYNPHVIKENEETLVQGIVR